MRKGLVILEKFSIDILDIVLLIIAIALIVTVVIPLAQTAMLTVCYGKFVGDIRQLEPHFWDTGDYKNRTVHFGDCVSGVFFVNEEFLDVTLEGVANLEKEIKEEYGRDIDLLKYIDCNTSKPSHIIGVPRFAGEAEVGGLLTWIALGAGGGAILGSRLGSFGTNLGAVGGGVGAAAIRSKVIALSDQMERAGKKPFCIDLDKHFASSTSVPGFTDDIKDQYCIVFYTGGELYRVEAFEGECGDNAQNVAQAIEYMKSRGKNENIVAMINLARTHYDEKKYSDAIVVYEELFRKYGSEDYENKDMDLNLLGFCYMQTNLYSKAIDTYGLLLKDYPKSKYVAEALLAQARAYAKAGNKEKAVENTIMAMRDYPDSPLLSGVPQIFSEAYSGTAYGNEAVEAYQQFISAHPDSEHLANFTLNLAVAYLTRKERDLMFKTYEDFLTKNPGHSGTLEVMWLLAGEYRTDGNDATDDASKEGSYSKSVYYEKLIVDKFSSYPEGSLEASIATVKASIRYTCEVRYTSTTACQGIDKGKYYPEGP